MAVTIKFFKAGCGDAIFIDDESNKLLIDAGFINTYISTLMPELQSLIDHEQLIDLCIVTHTDRDHINGIFPAIDQFGTKWVREFWFNYSPIDPLYYSPDGDVNVGVKQGRTLRNFLNASGTLNKNNIIAGQTVTIGSAQLMILSPEEDQYSKWLAYWKEQEQKIELAEAAGERVAAKKSDHKKLIGELLKVDFKEDGSFSNRSSIAILYQIGNFSALLTGDAHSSVLCHSIRSLGYSKTKPLRVDILKLSHHGSAGSTSDELLKLVSCRNYVISSSGQCDYLPNKQTLARILSSSNYSDQYPIRFLFNYDNEVMRNIFSEEDRSTFNFECYYASNDQNALIFNIDESTRPATIIFS